MKLLIGGPAGTWFSGEVARANLAKDLAARMLKDYPLDVCGEVTILDSSYTVGVIREALRIFQSHHPTVEPILVTGTTGRTLIVEYRKR